MPIYKSADSAIMYKNGDLEYKGRIDTQVKIRGFRIELGEIESVLQAVEGIERAVVVVRKDKEDRQLLCAFYTGEEKSGTFTYESRNMPVFVKAGGIIPMEEIWSPEYSLSITMQRLSSQTATNPPVPT